MDSKEDGTQRLGHRLLERSSSRNHKEAAKLVSDLDRVVPRQAPKWVDWNMADEDDGKYVVQE